VEDTTHTQEPDAGSQADADADIDALIAADEAASGADTAGGGEPESQSAGSQASAEHDDGSESDSGTRAASGGDGAGHEDGGETGGETGGKAKTAYEKAKERQAKAWQKLEAEKAQVREQQRILEERERGLQNGQGGQGDPSQTQGRYSKSEYESYAKNAREEAEQLEQDGKFEEADRKRALASMADERAREAPEQAAQPEKGGDATDGGGRQLTAARQAEFNRKQRESWERAKSEIPDLADKDSETARELREVLQESPSVFQIPEGPYMAAQYVSKRREAARVPGLEQENKTLKARVQELEEATSPGGGGTPPGQQPAASFEQKSIDEQESELRQELGV